VSVAKHLDDERVIALDQVAERLEMGRRRGAEVMNVNDLDDIPDALRQLTDGPSSSRTAAPCRSGSSPSASGCSCSRRSAQSG
jgi:Zn-dependent alcohol dehydrogenase